MPLSRQVWVSAPVTPRVVGRHSPGLHQVAPFTLNNGRYHWVSWNNAVEGMSKVHVEGCFTQFFCLVISAVCTGCLPGLRHR